MPEFQSTPPQGGDNLPDFWWLPSGYFNPHHRKVVTHERIRNMHTGKISIHTTARW